MNTESRRPTYEGASYLRKAFTPDLLIEAAKQALTPHLDTFDTFVGRSISGALVVPLLAHVFGKTAAVVRKPGVASHSWATVEGRLGDRWLFVDDLIQSGQTLTLTCAAIATIEVSPNPKAQLVGAFLYAEGEYRSRSGLNHWIGSEIVEDVTTL